MLFQKSSGFVAFLRFLFLVMVVAVVPRTPAQDHSAPTSIRTIAVGSMGDGANAEMLRHHIVERLQKYPRLRVATGNSDADVTLRGSSSIWATGAYSVNPRSKSYRVTTYAGYLSVELASHAGQTLWSYLVTPSRFRSSSIIDNLADQAVSRLMDALQGIESGAAPATIPGVITQAQLHAAGSTLAAPLYLKWFESSGTLVTYDANGSEAGVQQLAEGKIDFAASDMPPTGDAALSQLHLTAIPTVVGGVVPIYNIAGVGDLRLTPALLAGIYSGTITKWNDARIRSINHGARLPGAAIAVVHRSDGSGTTFVWTSYLSLVSPEWKKNVGAGSHVQWPAGVGATGNDGVAETVQKTPNAIGYVELIFAIHHELSFAQVENPAGQFIKADLSSITVAAADTARSGDQGFSILNSPKKDAYPISTFTWLLIPSEGLDAQKKTAISGLVNWMLTSGQKQCASLGYVPLPSAVAAKALNTMTSLK
jgi:phosphate ABC transporter phosphate-binding protein